MSIPIDHCCDALYSCEHNIIIYIVRDVLQLGSFADVTDDVTLPDSVFSPIFIGVVGASLSLFAVCLGCAAVIWRDRGG